MYKLEESIKAFSKKQKKKYLVIFAVYVTLLLISLILFLQRNTISTFVAFVILVIISFFIHKTIRRAIIECVFACDFHGVVRKKHISKKTIINYIGKFPTDTTDIDKYILYIEDKRKGLRFIELPTERHLDLYMEGDEIVCYSGSRYPIVISRIPKEFVCPLCAEIILVGEKCSRCELLYDNRFV